ncbi:uncharacterized protein TRIADDRAFT_58714 [Trichoplax adhaerens]|uniref:Phosphatidylcholine transfer protein n=1 Tax=Trichoplax adhaerens TaxID=10228 RepID=B3S3G6_TRIAD|nr:hypothetical protein TRIADDRAFT_58714 [Trichoplax adhaerens]EDV22966.1 hypothetical protein TRIADDRAFT_58714 [Trichoplax adhaerens]|eukprot:XP_002114832.1 hypothetical protein TRIADDRAFT_58714 [Trichoplax adhaerens]
MLILTGIKYCSQVKHWIVPILPSSTRLANVGQLTRALSACFALKSYDSHTNSLINNIQMPSFPSMHSVTTWWKYMFISHMHKRYRCHSDQGQAYKQLDPTAKYQHRQDDKRDKTRAKSRRRGYALFAAAAGLFSWDEYRISDEELRRIEATTRSEWHAFYTKKNDENDQEDWEIVMDQGDFKIWRKAVPGTSIYQYKVIGTYKDISANQFYTTQRDLEYRKQWDTHVVKLEVHDRDPEGTSELVYWESHYPFPLSNRDYVYVRRGMVDESTNTMTILSKSVSHPDFEETATIVRGSSYNSMMIIKPHTKFNKPGLDYLLIYFDDPKGYIPSYCLNWAASSVCNQSIDYD